MKTKITTEAMMMIKALALGTTEEARAIRALLEDREVLEARALKQEPKNYPPCDCANPEYGETTIHEPHCSSHLQYGKWVEVAVDQWIKHRRVTDALKNIVSPQREPSTEEVAALYAAARTTLESSAAGNRPGDDPTEWDDLPF